MKSNTSKLNNQTGGRAMTDKPQEPRDLIQICTDIYYECETIKHLDELTDEALDWHNKQMSELLDRLAIEVRDSDYIGIAETIQSERNKLTMANPPQLDKLKEMK